MAARRLFAAVSAVLGFSALASAQCPTSGCGTPCGSPVAVAPSSCTGCPTGVAGAPISTTGTYVYQETGRRGLFGGRLFGRRSSEVVQAGFITPTAMSTATPVAMAEGCPAPMPASGVVTTSGTTPPMPMPGQAVAGTAAPSFSPVPTTPANGTIITPSPMTPSPLGVTYSGQPVGFETSTTTTSSRRGLFSRVFRFRR